MVTATSMDVQDQEKEREPPRQLGEEDAVGLEDEAHVAAPANAAIAPLAQMRSV